MSAFEITAQPQTLSHFPPNFIRLSKGQEKKQTPTQHTQKEPTQTKTRKLL